MDYNATITAVLLIIILACGTNDDKEENNNDRQTGEFQSCSSEQPQTPDTLQPPTSGPQGPAGPAGQNGASGPRGLPGPSGPAGTDGISIHSTVISIGPINGNTDYSGSLDTGPGVVIVPSFLYFSNSLSRRGSGNIELLIGEVIFCYRRSHERTFWLTLCEEQEQLTSTAVEIDNNTEVKVDIDDSRLQAVGTWEIQLIGLLEQ